MCDTNKSSDSTFAINQGECTNTGNIPNSFAALGLVDPLCEACALLGYSSPTAIQTQAIPLALAGQDIIAVAETGSGKTAAYALPILQSLLIDPKPLFALVLTPTRELAYQVSQSFDALGSSIGLRCTVVVGGMPFMDQAVALAKKPHIIVATPGRILEHLESTKGFSFRTLRFLVLDESDRMLDLDFSREIDKILRTLPPDRSSFLFSATMSTGVQQLQRASLSNPTRIMITSHAHHTVAALLQSYVFLPHKYKDNHLIALLTSYTGRATIVFARTVNEVQRLAFLLRFLGFSAIPLHGQLAQSQRLGALNRFRSQTRDILVATDIAARGLDIMAVDIIINYDLPNDSATYVHRVGRTARAGKSGKAISLVTQYDIEIWLRIENALGKKVEQISVEQDEILVLAESIGEAQRKAILEMKNIHGERKRRDERRDHKGRRKPRDNKDQEN